MFSKLFAFLLISIICLTSSSMPCSALERHTVPVNPEPLMAFDDSILELREITDEHLTQNEIDLIATVVMAEAEAEPEEGQRLVIDTIFNRVDAKEWPNTISEVINQKNQYTSEDNSRFHKCYPREDLKLLVIEEYNNRTDSDVVFFRTGHYFKSFGTPVKKVGHHYFSKL